MNDGRENDKKLFELHEPILLLIVYETGLGILKGSFDIRNLIILKQAEITNSTVFNLSVLTISLSQIDKGCIFPSFVVWNHLNEHTGLLSILHYYLYIRLYITFNQYIPILQIPAFDYLEHEKRRIPHKFWVYAIGSNELSFFESPVIEDGFPDKIIFQKE